MKKNPLPGKQFITSLCTKTLSYQELLTGYLPRFKVQRKQDIFEKAFQVHRNTEGNLSLTRCIFETNSKSGLEFKKHVVQIKTEAGFFDDAADTSSERRSVWYLNFADPNLFFAWDSKLFAQDEIQTLEHPLLCALRKYMEQHSGRDDEHFYPCTIIRPQQPTPILIENVPYWISVDTRPRLADGTIANIYGNSFMTAPQEAVEAGLRVVEGSIQTNILAIAALEGAGAYSKTDIEYTLKAALAGFAQAAQIAAAKQQTETAIHTGNWGCGAFGGDKEFMYLVQIIAAGAVGITEIIFHGIDKEILARAEFKWTKFVETNDFTFERAVDYLLNQKYFWGMSDGN